MINISYAVIALIGMLLLTGWGIGCAIYGSWYKKDLAGVKRFFRQMTLYWGIINTIIGISAVVTVLRAYDLYASDVPTQLHAHNLFRINALIDLGYIAVGAIVAYVGKTVVDKRRGFGLAIIVQGIVLLIIDASLSFLS